MPTLRLPATLLLLLCACSRADGGVGLTDPAPPGVDTAMVPLTDFRPGQSYRGFAGGLYPDRAITPPPDHHRAGVERAGRVQPLDPRGVPARDGRIVLLSIGMSNTTQEFCHSNEAGGAGAAGCAPWTFGGRAAADPTVSAAVRIVDGARGGQVTSAWSSPGSAEYQRIRDQVLGPAGLSEAQVQVAWVKVANRGPTRSLPAADADAYQLLQGMGQVVRALRQRYPNLQQVFFSSRIYAGYATTPLNPEPYAYESGFAVKWLVGAQLTESAGGAPDPRAGSLSLRDGAPWLAWGPYLWARGLQPRSDGATWAPTDFQSDGTHPSQAGEAKVGAMLLEFFKTSPYTRPWFVAG